MIHELDAADVLNSNDVRKNYEAIVELVILNIKLIIFY